MQGLALSVPQLPVPLSSSVRTPSGSKQAAAWPIPGSPLALLTPKSRAQADEDEKSGFLALKSVAVGGIRQVLTYAEQSLHAPVERRVDASKLEGSAMDVPSEIKTLSLMAELRRIQDEKTKATLELHARKQEESFAPFIQPTHLTSKYNDVTALTAHFKTVMKHKGTFASRLQEPFTGQSIAIEPHLQKGLVQLMQRMCKDIAAAEQMSQAITFARSFSQQQSQLNGTMERISAQIAVFQRYSETLAHMRHAMEELGTACLQEREQLDQQQVNQVTADQSSQMGVSDAVPIHNYHGRRGETQQHEPFEHKQHTSARMISPGHSLPQQIPVT